MNKPANDNAPLHYLSVCAGIEAASVAWHPLGWRACLLSEIEKFPRRVLAHHYPNTRQWGDFTAIRPRFLRRLGIPLPSILVGGTPCQAFSVAGARRSLQDARGNLTLSFVRLAHALANTGSLRNVVWENVPGVLSTKDNAFGCFLGALVGADDAIPPPGGRSWPNAGMVSGPQGRAAWRVLDAQYFGLAQRRRRVFVVADFGNGADPAAVLFEPVGMHGNFAPRREATEGVAGTIADGARKGGGYSTDDIPLTAALRGISDYGPGAPALRAKGGDCGGGSEALVFAPELARCDATREGNSQDYETTTMVAHAIQAGALRTNPSSGPDGVGVQADIAYTMEARAEVQAVCITGHVTHTLRADGFDASEDGTGRGTPIAFDPRQTDVPVTGDITGALDASFPGPAICFSSKDYGADAAYDISPTLRACGHTDSHANAGAPPAVAFGFEERARGDDGRGYDRAPHFSEEIAPTMGTVKPPAVAFQSSQSGVRVDDVHATLDSNNGSRRHNGALLGSAVRRLTPVECERLQGFPEIHREMVFTVCAGEKRDDALFATQNFPRLNHGQSELADVHVLIDSERQHLQILSQERLIWSASIVEQSSGSPLPIPTADFARFIAHIMPCVVPQTLIGRAESPESATPSLPRLSGSASARLYGFAMEGLVSDAATLTREMDECMKSITSPVGQNIPTSEQTQKTFGYCVLAAISGFIPTKTFEKNSFVLKIEFSAGYTLLPGYDADGPRYKALGNSMAVPCMRWIGERIARFLPTNDNEAARHAAVQECAA